VSGFDRSPDIADSLLFPIPTLDMDNQSDLSLNEVHGSIDTSSGGHLPWWKRSLLPWTGIPGERWIYGPGNWATDLAGGSKFGYSLIWVLLMSNLMALCCKAFLQLGIVRGMDWLNPTGKHTLNGSIYACMF